MNREHSVGEAIAGLLAVERRERLRCRWRGFGLLALLAAALAMPGELIGTLLGVGGAAPAATAMGLPVVFDGRVVLLSFAIPATVGVCFGSVPAGKTTLWFE